MERPKTGNERRAVRAQTYEQALASVSVLGTSLEDLKKREELLRLQTRQGYALAVKDYVRRMMRITENSEELMDAERLAAAHEHALAFQKAIEDLRAHLESVGEWRGGSSTLPAGWEHGLAPADVQIRPEAIRQDWPAYSMMAVKEHIGTLRTLVEGKDELEERHLARLHDNLALFVFSIGEVRKVVEADNLQAVRKGQP